MSLKLIYIPVNVLYFILGFLVIVAQNKGEATKETPPPPNPHTSYAVIIREKIIIVCLWEQSDIKTLTNGQLPFFFFQTLITIRGVLYEMC